MLFCNIQVIAQLHQLTHRPVHQTTVHRRLDTLLQVQIIGNLLNLWRAIALSLALKFLDY